jgi:hypothetical protein
MIFNREKWHLPMDLYRRVRKIFCAPAVTAVVRPLDFGAFNLFFSPSTLPSLLPSEQNLLNNGEEKHQKGQ